MRQITRIRYTYSILLAVAGILCFLLIFDHTAGMKANAAMNTNNIYTVKASSKPYKNQYINYSTYNDKTRQYYLIRSYLELLEKKRGEP